MDDIDLKLQQIVDNIERLEEEKKEISKQITDIYREAKVLGFDIKIIRKIISLRKMNKDERIEMEFMIEKYKKHLGML